MSTEHKVGIIGGSGLYQLENLSVVKEHRIETPFGAPSSSVIEADVNSVTVYFIARHGMGHTILPHEINYRANIYALKKLGATHCIGIGAVGSLKESLSPGTVVIPDQVIDKTYNRAGTFFGDGIAAHIFLDQPFCPELRATLLRFLSETGTLRVIDSGTYICMQGPALSTRAESRMHISWGGDLIGMTAMPEVKLAREAEIAYASICIVTDYDSWKDDNSTMQLESILETMGKTTKHLKTALPALIKEVAATAPSELVVSALKTAILTPMECVTTEKKEQLLPLLLKYLES